MAEPEDAVAVDVGHGADGAHDDVSAEPSSAEREAPGTSGWGGRGPAGRPTLVSRTPAARQVAASGAARGPGWRRPPSSAPGPGPGGALVGQRGPRGGSQHLLDRGHLADHVGRVAGAVGDRADDPRHPVGAGHVDRAAAHALGQAPGLRHQRALGPDQDERAARRVGRALHVEHGDRELVMSVPRTTVRAWPTMPGVHLAERQDRVGGDRGGGGGGEQRRPASAAAPAAPHGASRGRPWRRRTRCRAGRASARTWLPVTSADAPRAVVRRRSMTRGDAPRRTTVTRTTGAGRAQEPGRARRR